MTAKKVKSKNMANPIMTSIHGAYFTSAEQHLVEDRSESVAMLLFLLRTPSQNY
jgi:hypothetical protein